MFNKKMSSLSPSRGSSSARAIHVPKNNIFSIRDSSSEVKPIKKYGRNSKKYFKNMAKNNVVAREEEGEEEEFGRSNSSSRRRYNNYTLEIKDEEIKDETTDDFDDGIIKIPELSKELIKKDTSILPGLSDIEDEDEIEEIPSYDGFAVKVANGNILHELTKQNQSKIDEIKRNYKKYKLPNTIESKKKLYKKAKRYLDIIPNILKGKESTSYYYELAKKQRDSSPHETMAVSEKWEIDWKKYFGGYYGFKRQSLLGDLISNKFDKELRAAEKRNKTVSYWTTNAFSTYILANEIIIRMTMDDMKLSFTKAEDIIKSTVEFGIIVADSIEIANDVTPEHVETAEFMKEFKRNHEDESPIQPSSKRSRSHKDVLQVVLGKE
ncbi:RTC4-like domain-containing protein [Scheffersomyces amazonensis]|uniref:RTC4-like domain-containing protein n=1 Tax=Scheffersomyces amazonensis TaxID=1078765 RepID=UPI00315CFE56